ncbi:MAG TPA: aminopeptidase, partial [Dehalococcoidia bacterium]
LSDPWYRCQTAAIDALKDIKDPKALPHLQRIADRELDGRVVRMARDAVQKIRQGQDKGEEMKKLREEVDKLADENRALRDRLDKLEARTAPQPTS